MIYISASGFGTLPRWQIAGYFNSLLSALFIPNVFLYECYTHVKSPTEIVPGWYGSPATDPRFATEYCEFSSQPKQIRML